MNHRTAWSIGTIVVSILAWTALWSEVTFANVLWGAVIGAVLLRIVPLPRDDDSLGVRPLAAVRYLGYALWALVRSSAGVVLAVIGPADAIDQGIVEVPLRTRSVGIATLVANTVSLTPGTLTLELRREPPSLFVHVLQLTSIDEVVAEVRKLEDLAVAAFPPSDLAEREPA